MYKPKTLLACFVAIVLVVVGCECGGEKKNEHVEWKEKDVAYNEDIAVTDTLQGSITLKSVAKMHGSNDGDSSVANVVTSQSRSCLDTDSVLVATFVDTLLRGVNIEMILITNGDGTCNDRTFYIGKYEVTQRQWKLVMGDDNNPSHFRGDRLPVENFSVDDMQEFILKLNSITGRNYRLPGEEEWKNAASGGVKSERYRYAGSNNIRDVAWYYENAGDNFLDEKKDVEDIYEYPVEEQLSDNARKNKNRTHPVGTKKPNELGIYDMSGNVWEYVYRTYRCNHPYPASEWCRRLILMGGSWANGETECRLTSELYSGFFYGSIGFRIAHSACSCVGSKRGMSSADHGAR